MELPKVVFPGQLQIQVTYRNLDQTSLKFESKMQLVNVKINHFKATPCEKLKPTYYHHNYIKEIASALEL